MSTILLLFTLTNTVCKELWVAMLSFLIILAFFLRAQACMVEEKELELFKAVEEIFMKKICNHQSMDRYIYNLENWKLKEFEKFCHCIKKEEDENTPFCNMIFKRYYSLEVEVRANSKSRKKRETFEIKKANQASSGPQLHQEKDYFENFITDIVDELKVQYVVIMAEESEFSSRTKKVLKDIFKRFSQNGIRLSVEMMGNMNKNITRLLPVSSADRPCMFYLMGGSTRIMKQVIL